MKIDDLKNEELNYWSARAMGYKPVYGIAKPITGDTCPPEIAVFVDIGGPWPVRWNPIDDWFQAGQIMVSNRIGTGPRGETSDDALWAAWVDDGCGAKISGLTPLIAVVKCLIVAEFGEEISDDMV